MKRIRNAAKQFASFGSALSVCEIISKGIKNSTEQGHLKKKEKKEKEKVVQKRQFLVIESEFESGSDLCWPLIANIT